MRELHLSSIISVLFDAFLKIRSQSMISFELKGISKFLSRYMDGSEHLYPWLKDAGTEGISLGLKYLSFIKSSPELGNFGCCNFVKINHIMLKRIVCISLVVLFALPLAAQGNMGKAASADSLYEFCFSLKNDMFFGVFKENETQLKALSELVDCHRSAIEAGTIPLYVDGYRRSMGMDEENLGYTYADYDKYNVTEGVRVRQGSDSKNYWGINQLGITLVWKFNQ